MTLPNWNPDEYLVSFDDIRYTGPIIEAPLIFKANKVFEFLHKDIFPDAFRALRCKADLSSLLLCFSIIEYLAGYYCGSQNSRKNFISYLESFYPSIYYDLSVEIYEQLRCGLVHNLNMKNPWKTSDIKFKIEDKSEFHLKHDGDDVIFSIYHLIEDTRRSAIEFFYRIVMYPEENKEIVENFIFRFNQQDGVSSFMIKNDI